MPKHDALGLGDINPTCSNEKSALKDTETKDMIADELFPGFGKLLSMGEHIQKLTREAQRLRLAIDTLRKDPKVTGELTRDLSIVLDCAEEVYHNRIATLIQKYQEHCLDSFEKQYGNQSETQQKTHEQVIAERYKQL